MLKQTSEKETFGEKTVTQIGLVVDDIQKYVQSFAEVFGMERPEIHLTDPCSEAQTRFNESPTMAQARLAFFELENITIELIEPAGGPSTWKEFLDTRGSGIHHIAFNVKSMEKSMKILEENNGKLIQIGKFTGGSYAYMDMSEKLGLMIELLSLNS
jgi:4-hydroxyphenylpyruvate dioxygenase-like putative hemolysin